MNPPVGQAVDSRKFRPSIQREQGRTATETISGYSIDLKICYRILRLLSGLLHLDSAHGRRLVGVEIVRAPVVGESQLRVKLGRGESRTISHEYHDPITKLLVCRFVAVGVTMVRIRLLSQLRRIGSMTNGRLLVRSAPFGPRPHSWHYVI